MEEIVLQSFSPTVVPETPAVQSAQFTSSCTTIELLFNIPTDQGGVSNTFSGLSLFEVSGLGLSSSSQCVVE